MHTWVANRSIKPRPGESFLSRHRRPIVDFVEDGADGVHDMLLSPGAAQLFDGPVEFDAERYAQLGHVGPHASCAENCKAAMHAIGHQIDVVPQPVNFFTNTHVDADGRLTSPRRWPQPGAAGRLCRARGLRRADLRRLIVPLRPQGQRLASQRTRRPDRTRHRTPLAEGARVHRGGGAGYALISAWHGEFDRPDLATLSRGGTDAWSRYTGDDVTLEDADILHSSPRSLTPLGVPLVMARPPRFS